MFNLFKRKESDKVSDNSTAKESDSDQDSESGSTIESFLDHPLSSRKITIFGQEQIVELHEVPALELTDSNMYNRKINEDRISKLVSSRKTVQILICSV